MASCRTCGGELQPIASCPSCEQDVQWKCDSCSKETDVSIHTHDGRVIGSMDIVSTPSTNFCSSCVEPQLKTKGIVPCPRDYRMFLSYNSTAA